MGIYVKPKDFEELRVIKDGHRGAFVQDPRNGSWSWKRLKGWKDKSRKPLMRQNPWQGSEPGLWWDAVYGLVQESEDDWDFDFLSEWMVQLS